jgi:hypothetical protein
MTDLPLEYNEYLINKYKLDRDQVLDFSQIYSLIYSNFNLNFLYHDNATNIFSSTFNNTDYEIFEILIYNLLYECQQNNKTVYFYHIINKDGESEYKINEYNSINLTMKSHIIDIQPKFNKKNPKFLPPLINLTQGTYVLCLFEFDQNDFGHYGTMFYDGNTTIYIFDSMMQSCKQKITTSYNFEDIFVKKIFNVTGKNINYNIHCDDTDNIYSLEITGGSYNVHNKNINNLKNKQNQLNQYIMGVDNQNQFCYMWSFLNIILNITRIFNPAIIDFPNLHKKIIDNDIIPVVAIKSFILLLLTYYIPPLYLDKYNIVRTLLTGEQFFNDNFRKIITNHINYKSIYNDNFTDFFSVQFNFKKHYSQTNNFQQLCLIFIDVLDNIDYYTQSPLLIQGLEYYIRLELDKFKTSTTHDIFKITDNIEKKNNIHTYLINLLSEYEALSISKGSILFIKKNKKKIKYGGNKYELYKFKKNLNF